MASYEIISRKEAKRRGLVRFFTGEPCKRGHIVERRVISGTCVDCAKIASHKYTASEHGSAKKQTVRRRPQKRS